MKQNRHGAFYCFLKTIVMNFQVLCVIIFKFFGDHSYLHFSVQLTESLKLIWWDDHRLLLDIQVP